jgi:hypothetical protein
MDLRSRLSALGIGTSPSDRWTVPDLIDFDYYVDEDERLLRDKPGERKRLQERDRHLFRERIEPGLEDIPEHTPRHRSRVLRRWLEARRESEDPALQPLLPGSAFARGQRLVTMLLGGLGFVIGIGVASALLHYDGQHPVNVSWYIFWLVLLQILLAGTTIGLWYARRTKAVQTAVSDVSLLSQLARPLFSRAARWVQRSRLTHMPQDVQDRAKAREGLVRGHYALYGASSYLPMLIPAQVFGIGFNVGAILMTIALEWFTDLAFGWGSALAVQPESIHFLARVIAAPWSWLIGEGVGYPTLEQVAGTRISLKDPLYILSAENLRSWRWFLVLAVFTYGLVPRLILLGLSVIKQRLQLARLPFTHQRTQAVYARMVTPSLETAVARSGVGPAMPIPAPLKPLTTARAAPRPEPAEAPQKPPRKPEVKEEAKPPSKPAPKPAPKPEPKLKPAPQPKPEPKPAPKPEPTAAPEPKPALKPEPVPAAAPPTATRVAPDACLLLIHVDVADLLGDEDYRRLQAMLRNHSGWSVAASATFGGGSIMATQALDLIERADWQAPPGRVAMVQDGSQPPITENLRFLRAVRAAAGEQAQLLLALIGDPEGNDDDPLPTLSDFDFVDWQRKIEQLGDPYLRLEMLAAADHEDS